MGNNSIKKFSINIILLGTSVISIVGCGKQTNSDLKQSSSQDVESLSLNRDKNQYIPKVIKPKITYPNDDAKQWEGYDDDLHAIRRDASGIDEIVVVNPSFAISEMMRSYRLSKNKCMVILTKKSGLYKSLTRGKILKQDEHGVYFVEYPGATIKLYFRVIPQNANEGNSGGIIILTNCPAENKIEPK